MEPDFFNELFSEDGQEESVSAQELRLVYIARHADYNIFKDLKDLTERGRRDSRTLVESMRGSIGEGKRRVYLLSSTALRAIQTSEFIADEFGLTDYQKEERIHTEGDNLPVGTLELIDEHFELAKSGGYEAFIVCAHFEVVNAYPGRFVQANGPEDYGPCRPPEKGEAVEISFPGCVRRILPSRA